MNSFLNKIKQIAFPLTISVITVGGLGLIYLILVLFKEDSYQSENLVGSLLFFGVLSVFASKFFYSYLRKDKRKGVANNLKIGLLYLLNLIALPIVTFIVVKYIDKQMYPMTYLFDKIFTINNIIVSIKFISPYFLLITLISHFYHLTQLDKNMIAKLKFKNLHKTTKYNELKSQLSPHFLFNNISVLTGLIEEDPKKALLFSDNLATIYRYFLEKENEDVVLLIDEMDFVDKYISLLKSRYETAFNYVIINNNLNDGYILPLAIQQVIENVIKHNEVSIEKPITIKIMIENDSVIIENNINSKIHIEASNKLGINNIQKRYAFFTDKKIVITHTIKKYSIELPILTI